jgi:AraC-like DNA-binding protein
MIYSSHNCEGHTRIYADEPCRFVSVILSPEVFEEMATASGLPASLLSSMTKLQSGISVHSIAKLTPSLQKVSAQIISCQMENACKALFIEGKMLEFLSLYWDKIIENETSCPAATKSDIDKLYTAREILLNNIIDPPSIQILSSLCGLNEFKLKKLFPVYFGNTIHGVLQSERMNHAYKLLLNSDTSVNIVANSIGYINISHFIAAFRNEFGVTPGEILKKVRRKLTKLRNSDCRNK